ncbi:vitamin K epoxide reductase family protein [Candidatus Daviesbacteria bacterium]|nr:vitamin K epoxide reductase family protein [Candidatus Daviesbacteria bacterium]
MFNRLNRTIFVLSLAGLAVTAFLLYEYNQPAPVICPFGGTGCETVRASEYSKFFGISIPYLGIFYYLFIAIESILQTREKRSSWLLNLQLIASVLAVSFGIYLTYLEGFVIGAYCFWCVLSFIISLLILVMTILRIKENNNENRK